METLPRVIPLCELLAHPGEIIPPFAYLLTYVKPEKIGRDTILWAIEKIEKHKGIEYSNEKLKDVLRAQR